MNHRLILLAGAATLFAAGGIASAGGRDGGKDARQARDDAGKAAKLIAQHQAPMAVSLAESAVALAPHNADYRALLGQAYVGAGRFASARQAYSDAVTLAPDGAKAALYLALTQIATGDWAVARRTLESHAAVIAPRDRGLALALAGDPAGAVALLAEAARQPDATPKVRQNLALSLALAGNWAAARMVASADMAPAEVDRRIEQWAVFAQPHAASDQVASLLGVTPRADPGQPAAVALNAAPAASATRMAVVDGSPAAPPAPVVEIPAPVVALAAASTSPVTFGPRAEVVQRLPTVQPVRVAAARPVPVMAARTAAPAFTPAKGSYFVQLGAFSTAAVAQTAWGGATRRLTALAAHGPSGMSFTTQKGALYRLSVGGFTRADAVATCGRYRARGGVCFVRAGAGDTVAQWLAKPETRLAAKGQAIRLASR